MQASCWSSSQPSLHSSQSWFLAPEQVLQEVWHSVSSNKPLSQTCSRFVAIYMHSYINCSYVCCFNSFIVYLFSSKIVLFHTDSRCVKTHLCTERRSRSCRHWRSRRCNLNRTPLCSHGCRCTCHFHHGSRRHRTFHFRDKVFPSLPRNLGRMRQMAQILQTTTLSHVPGKISLSLCYHCSQAQMFPLDNTLWWCWHRTIDADQDTLFSCNVMTNLSEQLKILLVNRVNQPFSRHNLVIH